MTNSQGAIAPPRQHFDEEAYGELYSRANKTSKSFDLEVFDRALWRLTERPDRAKSGNRLADRLERDGKKHLRHTRRTEILSDSVEQTDLETLEKNNPNLDPPNDVQLDEIREAVAVIRQGLRKLNTRQFLVLMTKAAGGNGTSLSVRGRQFRNLVADARELLWLQPGVENAYLVVVTALGKWRYETVELLAPLTASMASLN